MQKIFRIYFVSTHSDITALTLKRTRRLSTSRYKLYSFKFPSDSIIM